MEPNDQRQRLRELARLFLGLGITAFGGPAAHIARMEEEVVRKRQWLTEDQFIDFLGATNLIPGPNSTEMAIHIGQERAGLAGLFVAGVCFIAPAFVITLVVAWFYKTYGTVPQVQSAFYGIKPILIAILIQALWNLGQRFRARPHFIAATLAAAAASTVVPELAVLLIFGCLMLLLQIFHKIFQRSRSIVVVALIALGGWVGKSAMAMGAVASHPSASFSLQKLFLFFLKIGSILYGSGYVLLAFLQDELVVKNGWLTPAQLIDAAAVGQITPGPVFTTATFIGYLLAGVKGGAVATLGIFIPSFVFVAISGRLVPRLRKSAWAGAFLDGVNAASLGLMVAVTVLLAKNAIVDGTTLCLAGVAVFLVIVWKVPSTWLLLLGGAVGALLKLAP
jgi:chromate transporter